MAETALALDTPFLVAEVVQLEHRIAPELPQIAARLVGIDHQIDGAQSRDARARAEKTAQVSWI